MQLLRNPECAQARSLLPPQGRNSVQPRQEARNGGAPQALMQQGGTPDHLMGGRTQGNTGASLVFVKSSKVRKIGCTGEGTRSPPKVGCVGVGEVGGGREVSAAQTLSNVLCPPRAEAGAHQNGGHGLSPASLCSLLPIFRAQVEERRTWSHSQAVTEAQDRALLPSFLQKGLCVVGLGGGRDIRGRLEGCPAGTGRLGHVV